MADVAQWGFGITAALGITAAAILAWFISSRGHDALTKRIQHKEWRQRPPLQIGSVQVLGEGWLRALLSGINDFAWSTWRLILMAGWAVLVILVLPIDGAAAAMATFTLNTLAIMGRAFVGYLPNLGRIVLVVAVVKVALSMLRLVFDEIRKGRIKLRRFHRSWARQTYSLVRFGAIVLTVIIIFPLLPGTGTAGFQGIAIFLGALISIGASSAVGNAVAGIVITYTRAFERGDRVHIGDTVGEVIERSMFVTRVQTIRNEEIAIPNQAVLAGRIVNFSRDARGDGVAIEIRVGLGYDAPWRQVHELLLASTQVEGIRDEPAPRVYQEALGEFAVVYTVHAFTDFPDKMVDLRSTIIGQIQDRFHEAGLEILSPDHVTVRPASLVAPKEVTNDAPAP